VGDLRLWFGGINKCIGGTKGLWHTCQNTTNQGIVRVAGLNGRGLVFESVRG